MKSSSFTEHIKKGLIGGFFWAIGVSLGFTFVSIVTIFFLSRFISFPVVGGFVASVVEATQATLQTRSPASKLQVE